MRANGLIRENLDGMEDLDNKFVLRGVPHIQALRTSVDSNFGAHTGWSGDGAPGSEERENNRAFMRIDGLGAPSLRSFATGAVIQHFTRTLNRRPGVDFILPTERQLIALEAYMLTVGRQGELSLPLRLRGAVASRGQALFMDSAPGGAQCSTCHFNAGANVNPAIFGPLGLSGNQNFDTGIESLLDTPARLLARPTPPVDDGQGRGPGDGTFNTPGLVEAADTGPFFHNNSVTTLESAVEFYDSDEFNDSPAGRLIIAATGSRVELDTMAVQNIAGFLRVINALESIRQADALLVEARRTVRRRGINLTLARDEMQDAIDVLNGASLHPDAAAILQEAKVLATTFGSTRNNFRNLDRARALLRNARGLMAAP